MRRRASARSRSAPIAAGLLLVAPLLLRAQDEPAIDLREAAAAFESARLAGEADGGRLWGVEIVGPLLLVDRGSRFVVADRADLEGALAPAVVDGDTVWTGSLPESQNPANTSLDWGGRRWAMILWPTPTLPHVERQLLVHESFHRIQEEVGLPAGNPVNSHLDTRDGRIWLRMEMRALARALVHSGGDRVLAIDDALQFRDRRRRMFEDAAEEEDALERNEGLAEYTGLVLSGLPEDVLADRAAVALERAESSPTLSRSFAYATGPAYGVLLDEAGASWREALVAGASLAELLERAYRPEPMARLAGLWPYGGHRVLAEEQRREARRTALLTELRARFVEGPVLRLPTGSEFRYAFDPNAATTLDDLGTVYETTRVTSDWGILEVDSGGALMLRSREGITGVVVPAPPDPAVPTSGEGWSLDLAEGWEVVPGETSGDWRVRPAGEDQEEEPGQRQRGRDHGTPPDPVE